MKIKFVQRLANVILLIVFCSFLFTHRGYSNVSKKTPIIYPVPQEILIEEGNFVLNEETIILIPLNASSSDLSLAHFLVRELSDKYRLALKTERVSKLPSNRKYILMGSVNNPLVKEYCFKQNLIVSTKNPGSEGYILKVSKNNALVAGSDRQGAFYGLQSLRQLIKKENEISLQCLNVRDWPDMPFRGIKLYIPGRDNIHFFKRFISDFMALYKFNKVIIEVNAVMRFDRHPELNAGWIDFAEDLHYTRRSSALGPGDYSQNSTHHDAGDGGILEKDEVRDLVQFCNQHYIEVIPEIPTLTHTYYLLTRHRELADVHDSQWPSTYCPSNPKTYELLFDVFDEYIEVMKPKMIHIGRDEWWGAPKDYCSLCKGKDYFELFEQDLNKIYNYLTRRGIKVAMWGDHLLENVRGKGYVDRTSRTGYKYQTPGGLPLSMVKEKIPKDILIFNWFFNDQNNDIALEQSGFKQVYGNFLPSIINWDERRKLSGVIGGAPSSWTATTEFNFGKDLSEFFLGCASLLWSNKYQLDPEEHFITVQNLMPKVRMNLDGKVLPSEGKDPVIPLIINNYFNTSSEEKLLSVNLSTMISGRVSAGNKIFDLANTSLKSNLIAITVGTEGREKTPVVGEVKGISIDDDVTSLIFLHACARKANNEKAYRKIFNFDDSSDLLGWYEVVYEDGFKITIPIRYGYNILEWNVLQSDNLKKWYDRGQGSSSDRFCYGADAVDCSSSMQDNPISFFAFEWINTRLGKKIKEINLKGSSNFINSQDRIIEKNAIILSALSAIKKREIP